MGMRFTKRRTGSLLAALSQTGIACGTLLAATVARAELDLSVGVGAGYSDNIRRTAVNEQDETIGMVQLDLAWREQTRRFNGDVTTDLSYNHYVDDTYDSEVLGTADANLLFHVMPDHFSWLVQDYFGQAQSDPFAPLTPENRENLNYFATGPEFYARLGSVASLRLYGRYSRTDYERSPLDAERTSGGIGLLRQTGRGTLSLNAVTEQTDFEQTQNPDYDRDNLFVGYELEGARTTLTANVGYTWLERETGEKSGGALIDIVASREISASSVIRVTLGTQLTDAGEALGASLQNGGIPGGGGRQDITATSDPFENRSAGLEWQFNRNRTSWVLGALYNDDKYETLTTLDRTSIFYNAQFNRQISRQFDWSLRASLSTEDFDNVDLESDETQFGVALTWRPGRHVGFTLSVDRYDRNTSTNLGEYTENRAFLLVTYRPREPAALPPRR